MNLFQPYESWNGLMGGMSGDACTTAGSNGIASSPLSVSSSSGSNNERAILPELQQIKE